MAEEQVSGVGFDGFDDLTEEEFLEVFREFNLSSPIRIPKDKLTPNYVYKWINRADSRVFQLRRAKGWVPIKATELPDLCREGVEVDDLHLGTHVSADGHVCLGDDLILARMSRRRADAIRTHLNKINSQRMQSGRAKFHDAGRMLGVNTFEEAR